MPDPAEEIRRLQSRRTRRTREVSITGVVESMQQQVVKHHRQLGALIELWEELLPAELADATTLQGLRGGVLTVSVESSAVSYELDRRLREGLLAELRGRYRGTLARVRLQIGPPSQR